MLREARPSDEQTNLFLRWILGKHTPKFALARVLEDLGQPSLLTPSLTFTLSRRLCCNSAVLSFQKFDTAHLAAKSSPSLAYLQESFINAPAVCKQ